jgi:hypothetical protein
MLLAHIYARTDILGFNFLLIETVFWHECSWVLLIFYTGAENWLLSFVEISITKLKISSLVVSSHSLLLWHYPAVVINSLITSHKDTDVIRTP